MTVTDVPQAELDAEIGAYAERIFQTGLAALEVITVSLGRELGFYRHLAADVGVTPGELSDHAGIDGRYAREWLEQQAAAGLVEVTAPDDDGERRRYGLSVAAQECLLRLDSLASVGPLIDLLPSFIRVFPARLADVFRTGRGIPYAGYQLHDAKGDFNRPGFVSLLASEWLPAVPGLVERLDADAPAPRRSAAARGGRRSPSPKRGPPRGRRLRQRRHVHRRGAQARRIGRGRRPCAL